MGGAAAVPLAIHKYALVLGHCLFFDEVLYHFINEKIQPKAEHPLLVELGLACGWVQGRGAPQKEKTTYTPPQSVSKRKTNQCVRISTKLRKMALFHIFILLGFSMYHPPGLDSGASGNCFFVGPWGVK